MKKQKSQYIKGLSRRHLLAGSALGGLAMALPSVLIAQQNLVTSRLIGDIHLISGAGCNVVVAIGADSVLVVDGGLMEHSGPLQQEIDRLGQGKPVSTLFNTNWRPQHCGLNHKLGPAGVNIIAHENTRLWQNNDFYVDWEERHYTPLAAAEQANQTFYKSGSLVHGGETVDYGLIGQFHTDGDIYIYFRESNVIITGDMMTVGAYPLIDYITGGSITGAQKATSGLLDIADAGTLVVPASGEVQARAALEVQKQMLDHAYEKVADAYRTGRSLDQFMATAPMADYDGIYGDSALFVELLYRGTWYHVPGRAIRGII
jgi:glyoxylase-like metal-dependent hydrolase (beta-lactamase superfamily II)